MMKRIVTKKVFKGMITDLQKFNRMLTKEEIAELYSISSKQFLDDAHPLTEGLVACWITEK